MAHIKFTTTLEKKPLIIAALQATFPKLKNAHRCVAIGEFCIANDLADKAVEAIKPHVTDVQVTFPDKDVEDAFDRFERAFGGLEERLSARTNKNMAKILNAAADFIEKL